MDSWTDGTDMNFADHVGGQWPESADLHMYPVISRHEMVKSHRLSQTPYWLIKFTRPGEEFAFCKLYCGDLGYYQVVPVNALDIPASESVN
jgi:hypothetical protein